MSARLLAIDEGQDIPLDHVMVVVGRHPQCNARLDSLRVSRHHCCMTQDQGEVFVRDLGSTNGIRINGQRVESGRLRPGDELSIAHIRFKFDTGNGHDATLPGDSREALQPTSHELASPSNPTPDPGGRFFPRAHGVPAPMPMAMPVPAPAPMPSENRLAAAVREQLPAGVAERCRIQVIVQMLEPAGSDFEVGTSAAPAVEDLVICPPDLSP